MKNQINRICIAIALMLCTLPFYGYSQCGAGETSQSYCYGNGEVNNVAFEFCPAAGQIAQSEFIAGSIGNFIPLNTITVYEGVTGSATTGSIVFGPFTSFGGNVLTGNIVTATAPDLCLIFVFNSNTAALSCQNGFDSSIEVCSESLTATTVSFTAPNDLCINEGAQNNLTGGSPAGGVYSGMGVSDNGNGSTYSFDPAVAGAGTITITYTLGGNAASDDVTIFSPDLISFSAPADLCIDAGILSNLSGGTPTGGIYSGPGVSDNGNGTYDFNPGTAGLGLHTITYTLSGVCMSSGSDMVEVLAACGCPASQSSFFHCSGPSPEINLVVFEVCPSVGAAAQANIIAGTFNASFGNSLTVYEGASGSGTSGNIAFGPGAGNLSGTTISGLAADNCLIFVSNMPSSVNCSNGLETALEVCGEDVPPSLAFMALEDLCINAGIQLGLTGGLPAGGTYAGPGVTDNGNGMSYSFDPNVAGLGVHTLSYTVSGNSVLDMVEVFDLGTAGCLEFVALSDLCIDAGVQNNLSGGMPVGGVYSGPGVTDDGNGMTYDFDPAVAGLGTHSINYTIVTGTSVSDEVQVFALPNVTFTAPVDVCITEPAVAYNFLGAPSGGSYSGPGVTDLLNGISFVFNPAIAGAGVHNITYEFTSEGGCTVSASDMITVIEDIPAQFTALVDLCIDAGLQSNLGGGTPIGGVYSGPGVTDNNDGVTYNFDPASAGAGQHVLVYTTAAGTACPSSFDNDVVEVFALPTITFNAPPGLCIDEGVQSNLGGGTPMGGLYSGLGISDNGNGMTYNFDPAIAGIGVHVLTYTYTDVEGCSAVANDIIEIFALPTVSFIAPNDLCIDAGIQVGQSGGTPVGGLTTGELGVYSGPGVNDDGNGMTFSFDPNMAGVGLHTITYTFTNFNDCSHFDDDEIEVFALPAVTFMAPMLEVCIEDPVVVGLDGGMPTGGIYSGTGVSDDGNGMTFSFDPTAASPLGGNVPVSYSFTNTEGCSSAAIDDIFVDPDCCELVLDCSNIFDQNITCRADLPSVDFDLLIPVDSCGDVTKSALTIIPGNAGCPGDEVLITRTYFAQDPDGNMAECMQIFTVVSETAPTIMCPADMTVACSSEIIVSANNATTTSDCSTPIVNISGPVISGDPDCPLTTYTYTYTAIDFCNRSVSCNQIFTIANDAPSITCPADRTIECAAAIDLDPSDAIVLTSCSLGFSTVIAGPVILGDPDCPLTTYTYTYTATDDCGRTASCDQIFTIENDGPTIICPANSIVECFSDIAVDPTDATVITSCTLGSNTVITGPIQVGPSDCPGTRYTYTYTVTDDCGRTASCDQIFTIQNEGPAITCPPGFEVECAADIVVDPLDVAVVTSCTLGFKVEITGPKIVNGEADCPGTIYKYHYVVKDECGRQALCTREFSIQNDGPQITCPMDQTVACESDIKVDTDQVNFVVACGMISEVTSTDPILVAGQHGCNGSQYEVTYIIRDFCSREAMCTQTWTIQNTAPIIEECAPNRIVECLSDIEAEIDLVKASSACSLELEISASDPIAQDDLVNCSGATYIISYSVRDECGRVSECFQTWIIENNAPWVIPPESSKVACFDDIEQTILDAEVYPACGIQIIQQELEGPIYDEEKPLCQGSVVNYLYSYWDECGRKTVMPQVIIIDLAAGISDPIFDDVAVACDEVPIPETTVEICGISYELTNDDEVIPSSDDDYEIERTYAGVDSCGNIFTFIQSIAVSCSTATSSTAFCTIDEFGWSDPMSVFQNNPYLGITFDEENPIVFGHSGRELIITNYKCLVGKMPGSGTPAPIPSDWGSVYLDIENDCQLTNSNSNNYESIELFDNRLFSAQVSLALNLRANPSLGQVNLLQLCIDLDPSIIESLGVSLSVQDLFELGENGLMGTYQGDLFALTKTIRTVIDYFSDCNDANCFGIGGTDLELEANATNFVLGEHEIMLFPNPVQDLFMIRTNIDKYEEVRLQIFSQLGHLVFDQSIDGKGLVKINVNDYSPALHHVLISSHGKIIATENFIVLD